MSKVKIGAYSRLKYEDPIPREDYIKICEIAAENAGKDKCDLFVLPEHFDSFGSIEKTAQKLEDASSSDRRQMTAAVAEKIPGPMTKRFGAICRKYSMYIALNYYETETIVESGEHKIYNTCVLLDRQGNIAGKYRKTHLCGSEGPMNGVTAGDEIPVFDTDFGKLGITICMDMNYPEIYRVLTLKGAKIILWPHQTYGPTEEMVMLQARVRAMDNACYIVGSDFASPEPFAPYWAGHELLGRAVIINPDGTIIADTGHRTGTAIAEFDPELPRLTKDVVCIRNCGIDDFGEDIIKTRRPELYSLICKREENELQ